MHNDFNEIVEIKDIKAKFRNLKTIRFSRDRLTCEQVKAIKENIEMQNVTVLAVDGELCI